MEGEQEPERTEKQSEKQVMVSSMTTETPVVEEGSEMASWSGSNMLITTEVEEDNTIISVGYFSFHSKPKMVMRRRTKKAEGVVLWAPQGEKPEERAMESASALGAFVAMNLGAADESRKDIESLRAQVSVLTRDLQKSSLEHTDLTSRLEQECAKQMDLVEEN